MAEQVHIFDPGAIIDVPAERQLFRAEFFVAGEPKPQPRARSFVLRARGGSVVMKQTPRGPEPILAVHNPNTAEGWKSDVAEQSLPHRPREVLTAPVCVRARFLIPRPAYMTSGKWARPPLDGEIWFTAAKDVDNYAKALLDVLTVMGWWKDDGQVVKLVVLKRYAPIGGATGAMVTIEELEDVAAEARPRRKAKEAAF